VKTPEPGFSAQPRVAPLPLAAVTFGHVLLLALLLAAPESPEKITSPRPLMLSLIDTPAPEPAAPADPRPTLAPTRPRMEPPASAPLLRTDHAAAESQSAAEPASAEPAPAEPMALPEPAAQPEPAPVAEPVRAVDPSPAIAVAAPEREAPLTPPSAAAYLNNPKPPYPALSRRLGEEGVVRLNILVNPDGGVARLELAESSGFPRLDHSAMMTVRSSWKFEPAHRGGKPLAAWVTVPIQFALRS
jgi:periplasmic protein TonB